MVDLICCGAINWDINLFMERLPRTGEEVPVREIQRVSGGTAANVSVAAARILGPGRVAFIGALGGDDIAERQLAILVEEGVDASGILRVMDEESGQAYITIGACGENEIHTHFGANLRLTPQRLSDPERLGIIRDARAAVIMDPPLETAEALAGLCKENGDLVIWDPGVYAELELEALAATIRNVDYFILNHLEFDNLLGTSEPEQVGAQLEAVNRGIKAIIKHGREGCTLCGDGGEKTIHINAAPLKRMGLEVVNTVGCGDAFIGAFAASKVEAIDDVEALRRGCAAGSFKATRKETRGGPTAEQLHVMLRRWEAL
ncbi:MAG: PfkB family carbohydrate kinase [Candidatus Bathyarchaeota archaeon]|nr:PfkB family carbohydrate kinase [Candidatus Bathyarchaeota archaeon]